MKVDLSFSHPQLHPIEDAGSGVLALELVLGTVGVIADLAERAFVLLVALEVFLQ